MWYWVERIYVWCRRCGHSRGFGVQSPWAYRFIRYVVSEHYPYYAYEDLNGRFQHEGRLAMKLGRFYFRLSNFVQPTLIADFAPVTSAYRECFQAGCWHSRVLTIMSGHSMEEYARSLSGISLLNIVRLSFSPCWREFLEVALTKCSSDSVFVFEGIYESDESLLFWKNFIQDKRVGITFDLYYCGVAFFDKSFVKQDYFINF